MRRGLLLLSCKKILKILQSMGFEVNCAGDASYKDREENDKTFRDFGCKFYQIDMDARNPASRANLKGFGQIRTLINAEKYDFVHCHTPVAGALTRLAAIPARMGGIRVVYTTHGFAFHKYSSRKSWWMWYLIEKIMSLFCDAIITMNSEDYGNAKRMFAKNVYRINGVGLNTNRFTECSVDRESYRQKLGIGKDEFMILAVGEISERKIIRSLLEHWARWKTQMQCLLFAGRPCKV